MEKDMDGVNDTMNTKIKITVAKDKALMDAIYDIDAKFARNSSPWYGKTYFSDYSPKWEKEEVDMKTLIEYGKRGYATKINC